MNKPPDIMLETLPSLPFASRRRLPACPAVYCALSAEGTVLYIGQTQNLLLRWVSHNLLRQLADLSCALIAWYPCSGIQLHELESQLIQQFQPVLNKERPELSVIKVPVTLSLDVNLWRLFQKTCGDQGLTPSHEVEKFIEQQLAAWQHQPQKGSDHA